MQIHIENALRLYEQWEGAKIMSNNVIYNRTVAERSFEPYGLRYEVAPALEQLPLKFGVTFRYGGVSEGAFQSLNLGLHVNDDEAAVRENRKRLAEALGATADAVTVGEQIHGLTATEVTPTLRGCGATTLADAIPASDALYTDAVGVSLLLLVADCVPVLLYDRAHHAVAVVHAGWRGAVGCLPRLTLEAMTKRYGTKPSDVYAYTGPSIQGQSFEVGEEVADQFRAAGAGDGVISYKTPNGKPYVDLQRFIADDLQGAGVPNSQIVVSPTNSIDDERCFSYRRDKGVTGRMALFAMLSPTK